MSSAAPAPAQPGCDLEPAWWGRGLMNEALGTITHYAFGTLGIDRIEAMVLLDNERSCRTLERAGFRREALLREHGENEHGVLCDEHLFALEDLTTRTDAAAARGPATR